MPEDNLDPEEQIERIFQWIFDNPELLDDLVKSLESDDIVDWEDEEEE
jgi:hypothetical protein